MGGIFRHMVYCCLSSIPTSNVEGCLRTYQERVFQNGSAVCFPTTGRASLPFFSVTFTYPVRQLLRRDFTLLSLPCHLTEFLAYKLGGKCYTQSEIPFVTGPSAC